MSLLKFAVSVLVAYLVTTRAAADAVTDPEERLYNYLFNGTYNKSIRPGFIENGTKLPLIIHATFYPFRVVALDGRLESMSLLTVVAEEWYDPRLMWNSEDFGNLTEIAVKSDVLWTPRSYMPNILTLNRDDKVEAFGLTLNLPNETEPRAAKARMTTYAFFQERCAFDMTYFPFDQQTCTMCIATTQYSWKDLAYTVDYEIYDAFSQGGEWDLLGASVFLPKRTPVPMACITLGVQRRYIYYIINLFIPTVAIALLNTIGLFASIDADQNELDFATMGQTTLLSLGVMLLTVADQTPRGSDEVSLLGMYFLAMIFQTLLAALMAVYLRKWHRENARSATFSIMAGTAKYSGARETFIKKHAIKICNIMHVIMILVITATAIAKGVSRVGTPAATSGNAL